VKLAALRGGNVLWATRSAAYRRPTREQLAEAIRAAAAGRVKEAHPVGVCVPGLLEDDRRTVRHSVNVPGLNGVRLDELVAGALGHRPAGLAVVTDANATGIDLYLSRQLTGRLFVLAIGAGVGASVIDDGARPLSVDGDSPGHFGQMDVSIEGEPVVGPDGGAGSLEGYLSAAALAARYGGGEGAWVTAMRPHDPPMRALARGVRIGHAIYRPHHVCLAGGIGNRLGHLLPDLRRTVEDRLTGIVRPGWTLATGDSDFHAARGAARAAAVGAAASGDV
jgi:predicted NBD/HSP70 family sugar kinase